jgi:hypothetical protein
LMRTAWSPELRDEMIRDDRHKAEFVVG